MAFTLRELNLMNNEKPGVQTSLLRSSNSEIDTFFGDEYSPQKSKQKYRDIEDEDMIQADAQIDETFDDFFIRFLLNSHLSNNEIMVQLSQAKLGMLEVNIND